MGPSRRHKRNPRPRQLRAPAGTVGIWLKLLGKKPSTNVRAKPCSGLRRSCLCYRELNAPEGNGMNAIELIITVCAVLSPNSCEERHMSFSGEFSLQQCTMNAPPYIAQWIG